MVPVSSLRRITFGHIEANECGAMNLWLAASPRAEVAHGALGYAVSVADLADRPPRPLQDGEVIDLGGRRVRRIETPRVPHGWDAGLSRGHASTVRSLRAAREAWAAQSARSSSA